MRKVIDRLGYRYRLWRKERYGGYSADPAARNPLRFVAVIAVQHTMASYSVDDGGSCITPYCEPVLGGDADPMFFTILSIDPHKFTIRSNEIGERNPQWIRIP